MVSPSKRKISEDQQAKMQAARRARRATSAQVEEGAEQHIELTIRPPPVAEAPPSQNHGEEREQVSGNENQQQSSVAKEVGEGQGNEEQGYEQAANAEVVDNGSAFKQFQPVPEPDPFQQADPLGGAPAAMAGVEAPADPTETPLNPPPATTATGEIGGGSPEPAAPASRRAETVSSMSDDDDDEDGENTMPEGFDLAPGTTKAAEKRAYRSPQRFIDKEIAFSVRRDGCDETQVVKWRFTAFRQLAIIESWPNGRQPSVPVFRRLPLPPSQWGDQSQAKARVGSRKYVRDGELEELAEMFEAISHHRYARVTADHTKISAKGWEHFEEEVKRLSAAVALGSRVGKANTKQDKYYKRTECPEGNDS
ncbi:hypothetical protein KEM55_003913 [Ascosphaera atra]|nr:hypothetical protein KEM55_003913 [Ascosphaera atra]